MDEPKEVKLVPLFIKTIVWDQKRKGFYSPSKIDFLWKDGIIVAGCDKCAIFGDIQDDCTCGIYGSPNPETLDEYIEYPNSIIVLMRAYGTLDVWTAPKDLPGEFYVIRSWGARIVGVIADNWKTGMAEYGQRGTSVGYALEVFSGSMAYKWKLAREMIRATWMFHLKDRNDRPLDPFNGYEGYKWD